MLLLTSAVLLNSPAPRQRIDLDGNWEFARLPSPPSIWKNADAIPTSPWRVLKVSSEEIEKENGRAANCFDGDPKTFWHTEWGRKQPQFPHELVIDLGSRVESVGFRMLSRQTGPQNGRPKHFSVFISDTPLKWGNPAFSGDAPDSPNLVQVSFPVQVGRYLRLLFDTGQRPEPFLAISEIGLIRDIGLRQQKFFASQYHISDLALGDDRFDLNPEQLQLRLVDEIKYLPPRVWHSATLPHASWVRPMGNSEIWQGVTYYRRRIDRSSNWLGKTLILTLEGAMQNSDVWLNGAHVGSRRGGYLPDVIDVTRLLRDHNELLVRVDNRDNPLIPPGKPQQEMDYMYGSGLYRNVFLTATDEIYVTDPNLENLPRSGGIYVTFPKVESKSSTVRVRTHVRNRGSNPCEFQVTQTLVSASGKAAARSRLTGSLGPRRGQQFTQEMSVDRPGLWSPDHPNLYHLVTEIWSKLKLLDRVVTTVGIRKVEVSRSKGFVLNGQPIRLVGTNRHQDYPWVGPALSNNANARDALMIKRAGNNIVRLSHYPQSPEFLDACDRVGLMTIPCIPGWQFYNRDPRFVNRVAQDIRDLIRRDRNHPCAVWWEPSLNETYPSAQIANEWYDIAKSESLDGRVLAAGDGRKGEKWDVVYNQWVDEDMSRPQSILPDRPGYVREYGDYEFGGAYSSSRERIGDGMDALLREAWNHVWSLNRLRPQYPWTMGVGTWEMFDSNVPWDFQICGCGLADIDRREKPSYWFFQSQKAKAPFIRLAVNWQPGDRFRKVVVFTNCDQAILSLNGNEIARRRPKKGNSTGYAETKPFDGTNTENLEHPPIIFDQIGYSPGDLQISGMKNGRVVAKDQTQTSYSPTHLKVWIDDLGVPVGANDLVFVRAALVDAQGTICVSRADKIKFLISGAGERIGDAEVQTEMGVASNLLRTDLTPGKIVIEAFSKAGVKGSLILAGTRS